MNLFRKLALAGIGLAFVFGIAVTEASAQRYGRSYGSRGGVRASVSFSTGYDRGRSYGRYNSSYRNRRYYNNTNRRGLSWRERRILAIRRARAIRAVNRYQRTRARILNRRSYNRNAYCRNW